MGEGRLYSIHTYKVYCKSFTENKRVLKNEVFQEYRTHEPMHNENYEEEKT